MVHVILTANLDNMSYMLGDQDLMKNTVVYTTL